MFITLAWKGVNFKVTSYKLPVFCLPCDNEGCSKSSWNYYETTQNWAISYHEPPPSVIDGTGSTLPGVTKPVEPIIVVVEQPLVS